jgi:hypothetical protein
MYLTDRYPVFESYMGPKSLKGEHIKSGFTSHYVVVQNHGFTFPEPDGILPLCFRLSLIARKCKHLR